METSSREAIEQLVRTTAQRAQVPPPAIQWSAAGTGQTKLGGRTIVLGERLLDDAERARFTALHDLGHSALGHQDARRAVPLGLAVLASLLMPAVAGFAVALSLAPNLLASTIGFWAGAILGLVLTHLLLRVLAQPREFAADAWAARHGAVLTERIAAQMTEPTAFRRRLAQVVSTHPTPAQRAARVATFLEPRP